MKLRFNLIGLSMIIFLSLLFFSPCHAEVRSNSTLPSVLSDTTISHGGSVGKSAFNSEESNVSFTENPKHSNWWTQVQKNLQDQEYHISHHKTLDPAASSSIYQAPNRKQNLRTYFSEQGIKIIPRTEEIPSWHIGLVLESLGREERFIKNLSNTDLIIQGPRIEYRRDSIVEWYVNRPDGLEQGFILEKKLQGSGDILVHLSVHGTALPEFNRDEGAVDFVTAEDGRVLRYGKLHVFDDNGKVLPSRLELADSGIILRVDDTDAAYPVTIDPLLTSPSWTQEGNQKYAHFGASVRTAGDVNGDGYSDVIVGAPDYDNGTSDSQNSTLKNGKVFVFHGSAAGLNTSAAWTAMCDQIQARFGYSVGTAGDTNNDGYSDIVIGAPYYTNSQTEEGAVFVFFGSAAGLGAPATQADADWSAEGNQAYSRFGLSVSTAGDTNNDGYSDIIIGAPHYDNLAETDHGKVFVYYGNASGFDAAPWGFDRVGTSAGAHVGFSVATAGDVNGDGYSDVIFGAPDYTNGQTNEGQLFLFFGSSGGVTEDSWQFLQSNSTGANMGHAVAAAGDVNGDGYSDIIVGTPDYSASGYGGKVDVYYGASTGLGSVWTLNVGSGDFLELHFGSAVGSAGDVNADGYADIIIGAHGYPTGSDYTHTAEAYVYFGSATGLNPAATTSNADWHYTLSVPLDYFGVDSLSVSVCTAGDVDGDGFSDVVVGDPFRADATTTQEGRAHIFQGAPAGLAEDYAWGKSGQTSPTSYFGKIVGSAGDVNGDGNDDVFICAHYYDNDQTNEGLVFVFHGFDSGLSNGLSWYAQGNQENLFFGTTASSAGDVNGDGYSDLLIGAGNNSVYLYYGSASGLGSLGDQPSNADWYASGFSSGLTAATAGDVNGDGFSDIVIGSYNTTSGQAAEGAIYVYYGSSAGMGANAGPGDADWHAEGQLANLRFGYNATTAGDVNGDGYSDIIVGTFKHDPGEAYVYFGSATGLDRNGTRPSGEPANADWSGSESLTYYGTSVGSAGDVNGDGYSDIIVGAYGYPFSAYEYYKRGRLYVYHGSPSGPGGSPDWYAQGSSDWSYFGYAVGSAGDVNGDGFSDVIVGAPFLDTGDGKAYAYYGSATGLGPTGTTANADWSATYSGWFGISAITAGDVNGDGFSDVIVGDHFTNRAFVYYGNNASGKGFGLKQMQPGDGSPLSLLGMSDEEGNITISAVGRTPLGRGKVRLEWEAKPVEDDFDGTNTAITSDWQDTGVGGYLFNVPATGLYGHTNYHWRARLLYPAGNPLGQRHSRWFRPFPSNPEMLDFRTSNNPPVGGFTSDNVIPASQINQSTSQAGIVTIHFRIRDGGINFCTLQSFQYSVDGGQTWEPQSMYYDYNYLSTGWEDNNGSRYSSAIDWSGAIHSFTFNTLHDDVISDFDGIDQSDVRIRFRVNDGLDNSVSLVTSENFRVDCQKPATGTIVIHDDNGTTSDATPELSLSSSGAGFMRFALSESDFLFKPWVVYATTYSGFNISAGDNGEKTVWVEYRDQFMNIQTIHAFDTTTYDTSPVVGGSAISNITTPTWTWSSGGDGSGLFRYKLDNSDLTVGATEINGTSYTPPEVLSERDHTLYVQEWNTAGYWGWTGSFTIEIDSGKPCSEASSPAAVTDMEQTFTITYAYDDIYAGEACGSAASGSGLATVDLYAKTPGEDTYSLVDTDSGDDIDGQFSFTAGDQGVYDFYTIATDNAGNVELTSGSDTQTLYASQFSGYAILAVGAINGEEGLDAHTLTANNVYKHLIHRNFALVADENDKWLDPLDHIKYYNPFGTLQTGEDDYSEGGTVSYWLAMQKAVTQWALTKMTLLPGPLYIILIDHGTPDTFYLSHPSYFTSSELDGWLTTLENGLAQQGVSEDIVVILGTCYSGSFISELSKPGRIIVSSSAADEPSYRGPLEPNGIRDGEFFISSLFNELGKGNSLQSSFLNAVDRIEIHTDSGYTNSGIPYFDVAMQHPYLDDNHDGIGSHELAPGNDGDTSETIFLGYATDAPEPVTVTEVIGYPDTLIIPASHQALLWAKVSNPAGTERVWVEIREPGTTLEGGVEQQLVDLVEVPLTLNGDRYEATYFDFWLAGRYTLFFYAKDDSGLISPFRKSYLYKNVGDNSPPNAFSLISPMDTATVSISLVLDWENTQDTTDGHDISYLVTVSTNSNLSVSSDWVFRKEGIEHSTVSLSADDGIDNLTLYYWQVTAIDEYGAATASPVWSFTTDSTTNPVAGWIKGYVYNTTTSGFISNATVSVGTHALNSSLNGYYLGILTAGGYNATVSAPGYQTAGLITLTIPEGGILTRNFGLTPQTDSQPVATIVSPASNVIIVEGESVNFQGSVSGGDAPISFLWNFDGAAANSELEDPGAVTFLSAGIYTVTFTATDHDGDVDSDSVMVTVNVPDLCPEDPAKTEPGICGCGVPDTDTDGDGEADCIDSDDDNDGMPDDWEEFYGMDPLVDDADEDFDKDGLSNYEEYVLNSNPTDRNDPRPRALPWLPVLLE